MHNTMLGTGTTTRRLGAGLGLAALAFGLSAVGAAPAQAESGSIAYLCAIVPPHGTYDSDGNYLGPGTPMSEPRPMTAKFDSALKDGAKIPVGTQVQIAPIKATYTLSPALVDELLAYADGKMVKGTINLKMTGYIGNARLKSESMVEGLTYALKAGSSLTLKGSGNTINGTPGSFEVREGPHDFLAHEVSASLDNGDSLSAFLSCTPNRNAGTLIDLITGVDAKTAPAPAPAPSRPNVVQTDAEQPSDDAGMPPALVAGTALLALGGAVGARRIATRR